MRPIVFTNPPNSDTSGDSPQNHRKPHFLMRSINPACLQAQICENKNFDFFSPPVGDRTQDLLDSSQAPLGGLVTYGKAVKTVKSHFLANATVDFAKNVGITVFSHALSIPHSRFPRKNLVKKCKTHTHRQTHTPSRRIDLRSRTHLPWLRGGI